MRRQRTWLALLVALVLVVAACSGSGDDGEPIETTTTAAEAPGDAAAPGADEEPVDDALRDTGVSVFGPESSEQEAGAIQAALDVFAAELGLEVTYTGARDFSDQIDARGFGGELPDIAIFPEPGELAAFAREGSLAAVPPDVVETVAAQWPASWMRFGSVDGTQYGIPNKSDVRSLVWYKPAVFETRGYAIPETWEQLKALADQMIADGLTPWCVGIESGPATGWPATNWIEELVLRFEGADFYDAWVNHDVPFDSPEIEAVWNEVLGEWNADGAVFAASGSIATTPFGANAQPLADELCLMHHQASFFSAFFPPGTTFGSDGDVSVFYFPPVDLALRPTLVAGTLAAAFRDAPEVWAVVEHLGSASFAENRQRIQTELRGGGLSGFLSANTQQDTSVYQPLEALFVEILQAGDPARFDGSERMPEAVGEGCFWDEAAAAVRGAKTVTEALNAIEDCWPDE